MSKVDGVFFVRINVRQNLIVSVQVFFKRTLLDNEADEIITDNCALIEKPYLAVGEFHHAISRKHHLFLVLVGEIVDFVHLLLEFLSALGTLISFSYKVVTHSITSTTL